MPESTKAYARKEHFNLGFDKSGFKSKMNQTYNLDIRKGSNTPNNTTTGFSRTNHSLNVTGNGGAAKNSTAANMQKIMAYTPTQRGSSATTTVP